MQHQRIGRRRWGRPVYRTLGMVYYVYHVPSPSSKHDTLHLDVFIPKGFAHDFASIPWPLHYWMPPNGPWARAAVIHDRLCGSKCPRFLADAVFRHVMEQDGVRLRLVLYYAVRLYYQLWKRWFRR